MKRSAITPDIVHKIRQIEIYTKRLLSGALVGDSRSALKGTGFEFDQIREYQLGDDVRFIDWNASARMNTLLIKEYIEERSRVVLLAVDISRSTMYGSGAILKQELITQIAGILALVTQYGNDRVGLLLFSDHIECYMPPGRGKVHVRMLLEQLLSYEPCASKTRITVALQKLAQIKRKDAIVFLISDFIDDGIELYLPVVTRMYDCVAIRCLDRNEQQLPSVGLLTIEDRETGDQMILDTRARQRAVYALLHHRLEEQNKLFRRYGVDVLDVMHGHAFIGDIVRFFRQRMRY